MSSALHKIADNLGIATQLSWETLCSMSAVYLCHILCLHACLEALARMNTGSCHYEERGILYDGLSYEEHLQSINLITD